MIQNLFIELIDKLSYFVSWLMPIVVFLFIYGCLSDICFGHATFWRSTNLIQIPFNFKYPYWKFSSSSLRHTRMSNRSRRSFSKQYQSTILTGNITLLEDQVIRHFLGYLDVKSLYKFGFTSKYFYGIVFDPKLWRNVQRIAFQEEFCSCVNIIRHPNDFLDQLKLYPKYLAQKYTRAQKNSRDHVYIIISGNLYDVSQFIDYHPGGGAILLEMQGKDATKKFDVACHSKYAQETMKQYLVWSPKKWIS